MSNISNNKHRLRLYLNILYDRHNLDSIYALLSFLQDRNIAQMIDLILLSPTKPILKNNQVQDSRFGQAQEANIRLQLIETILRQGFRMPYELEYQLCTMKQKNSFVLTRDGAIYKCISGVGKDPFYIGDMAFDVDPFEAEYLLVEEFLDPQCRKCKYSPICYTNCRFESHVLYDLEKKECRRVYFDSFVPGYLRLLMNGELRENIVFDATKYEWIRSYS